MRLTLIAAVAENGVIGAEGGMPWHYPADLGADDAVLGDGGDERQPHSATANSSPGAGSYPCNWTSS